MVPKTVSPLPLFNSWMKADDRLIFLHWVPWPLWAEYDNPERYGLARMSSDSGGGADDSIQNSEFQAEYLRRGDSGGLAYPVGL
jgi:hypothetical protein